MWPRPDSTVLTWLNEHDCGDLYITAITLAKIGYGLSVLPDGHCRQLLQGRFEKFITQGFESRILAFDTAAAHAYAKIMSYRKQI